MRNGYSREVEYENSAWEDPFGRGRELIRKMGAVSHALQQTASREERKKLYREDNRHLVGVLELRKQIGKLPDGIDIWLMPEGQVTLPSDTPLESHYPGGNESSFNADKSNELPELAFRLGRSPVSEIPLSSLISSMLRDSQFSLPYAEVAKKARELIHGIRFGLCEESLPLPYELIAADVHNVANTRSLVSVLTAKKYQGEIDQSIASQSIHDIEDVVRRLTCRAIATIQCLGLKEKFPYSINELSPLGGVKRFKVRLPEIKHGQFTGYRDTVVHVRSMSLHRDTIDFLRERIDQEGTRRDRF